MDFHGNTFMVQGQGPVICLYLEQRFIGKTFALLRKTAKTVKVKPSETFPVYGIIYHCVISFLNGCDCIAELKSNNALLKMQVYELLSCLCVYSDEGYAGRGYQLSTAALQHYKVVINYEQM